MKNIYTIGSVEKMVNDLLGKGWELVQLREGTLGLGDLVLIAPDDKHYNFVIREVALNEWCSAQTMRRCAKISARLQAEIDAARDREDEE